uniref:AlkB homolog 8, tRNA methyltransferase n=1 Tax=Mus musculus TaxID=10090 RepID=A0A1D5RLF6_MOUSE
MNINHKGVLKLTKMEKKFLRKQSKARHVLLKHEGIQAVSYPTQHNGKTWALKPYLQASWW